MNSSHEKTFMSSAKEKRNSDRRRRQKRFYGHDRRKAPRRLTCDCGGLITMTLKQDAGRDWVVFACARCKRKETRYLGATR